MEAITAAGLDAALRLAATDPDVAREEARDILDGRRYDETEFPRPFEGMLEWLGERLRPVTDAWDAFVDWVFGGPLLVRLAVLALVIALTAYVAYRVARVRTGAARHGSDDAKHERDRLDPKELERRADRAERDGDLATALRLRFQAGLLRLDRAGLIDFRPSITSGEVTRQLRLASFARLANRHDEVAYGARSARPDDLADARATWPQLVKTAR